MKLREEYQSPAHQATIEHCRNSTDPVIHDQSVGAGKTIQIAFFAKHVVDKGGRVLVLARQGELVEQNADDYWAIGGKCSIYSASLNKKSTYYPCVMGTEGTIKRSLQTEFKNKPYNAILIDECHHVNWQNVADCMDYEGDFYNAKDDNGKPLFCDYALILRHFQELNQKTRVVGYTGSPYRGTESIIGMYWKKKLSEVTTHQLVELGYLVPYKFGFGDESHHYQYSDKFTPKSEHADFSSAELAAMGREACKQEDITQAIMEEVVERTRDRNGVLITCASKKHCEQVSKFLPDNTFGIVTDSISTKERRRILKGAKDGSIKYVIQIGCLTTGINVPVWDTCVIMRNIGSLTFLIQLIGRALRTLKDKDIENGFEKHDALILDYTDTIESLGAHFDNPIINEGAAAHAKRKNEELICPKCETVNSQYAVRCRGQDLASNDGRCEYFFRSTVCNKCDTENAPTAKSCRNCNAVLIDPALSLVRKAYSDADYKPVNKMILKETSKGVVVIYELDSVIHENGTPKAEVAKEYFTPFQGQPWERTKWNKFICDHIQGDNFRRMFKSSRDGQELCRKSAMLDCPVEITHRINAKGFSIINRKKFRSGRVESA